MNKREQQTWLEDEIRKVIDRAISEFDFTLAEGMGVLETVKLSLYQSACEEDDDLI